VSSKMVWNGWPPISVKWHHINGHIFQETYFDYRFGWQQRDVSAEWLSQCPKHKKPWTLYRFRNKAGALCSRWECFEANPRTKTGRCVIRPAKGWDPLLVKKEGK
jgi:hypothetical protein